MKKFEKIIKQCHECPNCWQANGQGSYSCWANSRLNLGYDCYTLPIPKNCPLSDFNPTETTETKEN